MKYNFKKKIYFEKIFTQKTFKVEENVFDDWSIEFIPFEDTYLEVFLSLVHLFAAKKHIFNTSK